MKAKIFTVILLCCLCGAAYSQTLEGRVMDERSQPLEFANVEVYALPDTLLVTGTITDSLGVFTLNISGLSNSVIKVSLAGYETATVVPVNGQTVVLKYKNQMLGEVSIVGERKAFEMKRGNLVANVAGTILENEVNAMEILRKIPGMTVKNGELSSFLYGNPVIYINGKKVRSVSEVYQLDVKNIKNVELNTNPGAEYDASTGAVLLITTHKRLEGLAVQVNSMLQLNHFWSHNNDVKINYKQGKFEFFGQIGFGDDRFKKYQNVTNDIINSDTVWHSVSELHGGDNYRRRLKYSLGMDYTTEKYEIGIKYDGENGAKYRETQQSFSMKANDNPYTEIFGKTDEDATNRTHYINVYYRGGWSTKLRTELFVDFLKSNNRLHQLTDENSMDSGSRTININTSGDNTLFAIAPKFNYIISDKNSFSFGVEYVNVMAKNELNYSPSIFDNKSSTTAENKFAAYLNYDFNSQKGFGLSAGVRYERVNYLFEDIVDRTNNIHRTYNNVFPNLRVSYQTGRVSQSLGYRSGIRRPNYQQLNGSTFYVNRFLYQEGNPRLIPEISHNIRYAVMYRFIYFMASYEYRQYPIFYYLTPTSPKTIKSYIDNFDKSRAVSAGINLKHKFWGFYTTSLSVIYRQRFESLPTYRGHEMLNKPYWNVYFDNSFELPKGFLLNIEYDYMSQTPSGFVYFNARHLLNVKVGKTFFDKKLYVNLSVNDILGKNEDVSSGTMYNIYANNYNYSDLRSLTLNVVWRFNNYNKRHKNEAAAEEEIRRL